MWRYFESWIYTVPKKDGAPFHETIGFTDHPYRGGFLVLDAYEAANAAKNMLQ